MWFNSVLWYADAWIANLGNLECNLKGWKNSAPRGNKIEIIKFLENLDIRLRAHTTQQVLWDYRSDVWIKPLALICDNWVQDSRHMRLKLVMVAPVGHRCFHLPSSVSVFFLQNIVCRSSISKLSNWLNGLKCSRGILCLDILIQ